MFAELRSFSNHLAYKFPEWKVFQSTRRVRRLPTLAIFFLSWPPEKRKRKRGKFKKGARPPPLLHPHTFSPPLLAHSALLELAASPSSSQSKSPSSGPGRGRGQAQEGPSSSAPQPATGSWQVARSLPLSSPWWRLTSFKEGSLLVAPRAFLSQCHNKHGRSTSEQPPGASSRKSFLCWPS